jgi:hypothetical protein
MVTLLSETLQSPTLQSPMCRYCATVACVQCLVDIQSNCFLCLCSVRAPESAVADFLAEYGDCFEEEEENVDDPLPLQEVDVNVPDSTPKKRRHSGGASPPQRKKPDREVGIVLKYDFGWDKRGSGFRYASDNSPFLLFLHCFCVPFL